MTFSKIIVSFWVVVLIILGCGKDDGDKDDINHGLIFDPTSYDLIVSEDFPVLEIPSDNSMTVEGVELGRMLFYDPILSGDSTLACAGCHKQEFAFTDENRFSTGIDNIMGDRNAMPVINMAWVEDLFWDGRAKGVEAQALGPVENPIEMHETWPNAVKKLKDHTEYPELFFKAFGIWDITKEHVAKAIAQFERILISDQSKFDKERARELFFSDEELNGFEIFNTEKGDCFHCHGGILATDNLFHNNGLDAVPADDGLSKITMVDTDKGKFKTPTLRNIEFTAPYMHDGRFKTLEEVIDFYSEGIQFSETIDALMKNVHQGGIQLTPKEKSELLAYLLTFSDTTFINNKEFSNPFK